VHSTEFISLDPNIDFAEALRRVFPFALQEQGKPTRVGGECEDKDVAGRIVGDEAFLAHLAKILEKDGLRFFPGNDMTRVHCIFRFPATIGMAMH
jgi:hypothetical protein